jgi:uncharacterized SAM-binding protein YcdF (DUF218 family)
MQLGELKPILTALALPPTGPLLLALLGILIATRRRAAGLLVAAAGIVLAWVLSTNGMALVLARHLMPDVKPATLAQMQPAQAIVVLGGGVLPEAPEYGIAQPAPHTLGRLRYGVWLARHTGKPLAFAGGVGWGAAGTATEAEGTVAQRVLKDDYGIAPRWVDDRSRDTAENASRMAALLLPAHVRRIVLVTDAAHIPRAVAAFQHQGFDVVPAPTDFPIARGRPLLEWLPSDIGEETCRELIREWLGRLVARVA